MIAVRIRSLQEGNVFSRVGLSVHKRGYRCDRSHGMPSWPVSLFKLVHLGTPTALPLGPV